VALVAARRDLTVVAHFHLDVDPTGPAGFLLPTYKRQCLARTLRRADAVVALTPGQAAFLTDDYGIAPERVTVVANGVEDVFLRIRHSPTPGRPLRLLFVGRLDRQKNVPRLLRALARVDGQVEVVIVGDGEDAARCRAASTELHLDHVRFVGIQHGGALVAWYQWADVFVLPSDREGMPLALLEAMAAGLGVITTNVSDLACLVGDGGLVVPPHADNLATAISRLAGNRLLVTDLQTRSRRRGRAFGWNGAVDQVSDLYESLPA
jgi:glycosyltransferase involved in cell wall biosynthesis